MGYFCKNICSEETVKYRPIGSHCLLCDLISNVIIFFYHEIYSHNMCLDPSYQNCQICPQTKLIHPPFFERQQKLFLLVKLLSTLLFAAIRDRRADVVVVVVVVVVALFTSKMLGQNAGTQNSVRSN